MILRRRPATLNLNLQPQQHLHAPHDGSRRILRRRIYHRPPLAANQSRRLQSRLLIRWRISIGFDREHFGTVLLSRTTSTSPRRVPSLYSPTLQSDKPESDHLAESQYIIDVSDWFQFE